MSKKDKRETQRVTVEIPSDERLRAMGLEPEDVKDRLQHRAVVIGAAVDVEPVEDPDEVFVAAS